MAFLEIFQVNAIYSQNLLGWFYNFRNSEINETIMKHCFGKVLSIRIYLWINIYYLFIYQLFTLFSIHIKTPFGNCAYKFPLSIKF